MKRLMYVIPLSSIAVLVFAAIAAAQPATVPAEESTTPAEESTTPAESTTPPAPNDANTVEIRNNAFNPAQLNVAPGTTVTFVNHDNVPHTATSDTKLFDLEIPPGSSYPVVLEGEGTVPYHCELHPEMKGTIVVGDGSGAEGTTTQNPTDDDPTQNMLQDMLEKML
jgi:plastocyanin